MAACSTFLQPVRTMLNAFVLGTVAVLCCCTGVMGTNRARLVMMFIHSARRVMTFTDRARYVMVLAELEARRLDHAYLGTEHLLLGLIRDEEGVAAKALESLGVSLGVARQKVETLLLGDGQGPRPAPPRHAGSGEA